MSNLDLRRVGEEREGGLEGRLHISAEKMDWFRMGGNASAERICQ